jgi:hypothetical protein
VITRHVPASEREDVIRLLDRHALKAREMEALLIALDWQKLCKLGLDFRSQRRSLLNWACATLASMPSATIRERMRLLALAMPTHLDHQDARKRAIGDDKAS